VSDEGGLPVVPGGEGTESVEMLAAALRADLADLDVYERVLVSSLSEVLPEGVLEVVRERSMGDRMAGRPGKVRAVRAHLGEHEMELTPGRSGMKASVTRQVRGVAISRKEVSLEEWAQLLAEHLSSFAAQNAAAREALSRLLGAGGAP